MYHGYFDVIFSGILTVFLFLLSILVKNLRDAIVDSRKEQALLRAAITDLTVILNRDFVTRQHLDKELNTVWTHIDKSDEKIDTLFGKLADLRAERADTHSTWRKSDA